MAEFILKDQYGKEKVFDQDKIFVCGTDGELVQFTEGTGDIPAVLQDKTITENGTYTSDSGYDGLGSVTVDVKGSGGGGSPYLMQISIVEQNQNKTNVQTTQSLKIPKGAKIIRAWADDACAPKQSYYPGVKAVTNVSLDKLVIDESNTDYDLVSYTHPAYLSSTAYESNNTYEFRLRIATDIITVSGTENGLFDGTLNQYNGSFFNNNDRGVEQFIFLKSLTTAEGVTRVPDYLCYKQIFLESADLSSVEEIGLSAFYGCESLKSISLNPNLKSLGQSAFGACTNLTGEIIIPNAITEIPSSAFSNTKFDRVVFPTGFAKVGYQAFFGCTHPTEFDFSACTAVPTLYLNSVSLGKVGNGQVLKIPSALFDSWSTAQYWKDWAAQMVAV